MNIHIPPKYLEKAFNCPHCNAYSNQKWFNQVSSSNEVNKGHFISSPISPSNLQICFCTNCEKYSLWVNKKMVYPFASTVPLPIDGMPEKVEQIYLEARDIVNLSPRGAGALIRLGLQELMIELGENGDNINADIGSLVEKGLLPEKIQKASDSIRIIGNEAVHPGTIDLNQDNETVNALFGLLNIIVDMMIVQPEKIDKIFDSLPEPKKEGIKNRDAKN